MNITHITQRLAGVHLGGCAISQGKACDCGALNRQIDEAIAKVEEALKRNRDRRHVEQQPESERREGFDRRARVAPAKE